MFEPLEFFLLRFPILPLENIYQDPLAALDEVAEEALAIATPSLLDALRPDAKARKREKASSALLRYHSRMTTRPTPFGIFAGVTGGHFGNETSIELGRTSEHRKRTRPDLKWLLAVIKGLEEDIEVVKQLKVSRNSAVLQVGDRAWLSFFTNWGQTGKGDVQGEISIRATEAALEAFALSREPILFSELAKLLQERYPSAPAETILAFLWQLFRQEFLISTLRPPLTLPSPLDYVIDGLGGIRGAEKEREVLLELRSDLEKYDGEPLGKGKSAYFAALDRMSRLELGAESQLAVDLAIGTRNAVLHPGVGEEAALAAECLWRLSPPKNRLPHIEAYHREFLERYGRREIPLLELLSEEAGMGPPATYSYPSGRRTLPESKPPKGLALLLEKAMVALQRGEREIVLEEAFLEKGKEREAPDSLEIYAEVVAASPQAIDRGDFLLVLGPNPGTMGAGLSFGRFLDVLDGKIEAGLKRSLERQAAAHPDVLFVKAVFLPSMGRWGNVVISPLLQPYELAMGTNPSALQSLSLDDVLVGALPERFYLRSRTLGKELRFQAGQMLSPLHSPNPYRFLMEVSNDGVRKWTALHWGPLEGAPYLPRVRYGRAILSPATWTLNERFLENGEEWEEAFSRWRTLWKPPTLVFLTSGDQRILLDLDRGDQVAEIKKEWLREKKVALREMVGSFEDRWITDPEGRHYFSEIVFPLEKKGFFASESPKPRKDPPVEIDAQERLKLPGSDWMSLKLYGTVRREEEWLVESIHPFAERMLESGLAKDWFFIRYQDPLPHIRLRFRGEPAMLSLLPELHAWAREAIEAGLLKTFSLDGYDREIERYGGAGGIAVAEKAFGEDSRAAVQVLRAWRSRRIPASLPLLAASSLIDLNSRFGLTLSEQREWLLGLGGERCRLEGAEREEFFEFLSARLPEISEAFSERKEAFQSLGRETGKSLPLLRSLVHMHCNRLLGREREKENRALALSGYLLEAQLRQKKEEQK